MGKPSTVRRLYCREKTRLTGAIASFCSDLTPSLISFNRLLTGDPSVILSHEPVLSSAKRERRDGSTTPSKVARPVKLFAPAGTGCQLSLLLESATSRQIQCIFSIDQLTFLLAPASLHIDIIFALLSDTNAGLVVQQAVPVRHADRRNQPVHLGMGRPPVGAGCGVGAGDRRSRGRQ